MKEIELPADIKLVQKILSGETHLFETIIRKYNALLYKTGRSYGYNHEETQDIMQDSYINAYLALDGYESRASFKTWIVKIMLNNCYRKKLKLSYKNETNQTDLINEKSIPMYSDYQQTDLNKALAGSELKNIIENSLDQLPFEYKIVFSMREINGFNVSETAEALNISESNVKVRLFRAKSMLRNEIAKLYSSEEIYEFDLIYCDAMVNEVMERIKILVKV